MKKAKALPKLFETRTLANKEIQNAVALLDERNKLVFDFIGKDSGLTVWDFGKEYEIAMSDLKSVLSQKDFKGFKKNEIEEKMGPLDLLWSLSYATILGTYVEYTPLKQLKDAKLVEEFKTWYKTEHQNKKRALVEKVENWEEDMEDLLKNKHLTPNAKKGIEKALKEMRNKDAGR